MMTSSNEDVPKELLIDADYLIYGVGFASEEDSEKFAKSRLVETMEDMVYLHLKADSYEAFLTGKNNYRYDIAKTVPYKGNRKDAKKPKHYDALRKHIVQNPEKLPKVVERLVDQAEAGEAWAVKELIDRLDGKAIQFQEITGAEGSPLLTGIEVTFVKPGE